MFKCVCPPRLSSCNCFVQYYGLPSIQLGTYCLFQPVFLVEKEVVRTTTTRWPMWRWINYCHRTWSWTWNAMFFFGVSDMICMTWIYRWWISELCHHEACSLQECDCVCVVCEVGTVVLEDLPIPVPSVKMPEEKNSLVQGVSGK